MGLCNVSVTSPVESQTKRKKKKKKKPKLHNKKPQTHGYENIFVS